ncbi:aspartic peptidase domain-containing protein [Mycena epipterygia]|nr:aspartic peptidase domain-containing protein [Mycena epipterygia]
MLGSRFIPFTKASAIAGYYSYPCASPPKISFNWGGKDWTISSANLNLGQTESGSKDCVSSLAAQDLGLRTDVWLLGDASMKNVYTVFDFDKEAVGFAELA